MPTHNKIGVNTANNGEKPNTKLDGPNNRCINSNKTPKITPVKIRCPVVTLRSGPKIKEIAISTKLAVAKGFNTFCQNDKL